MKIENQYIIQFKGLKEGVHEFEFILGKPFFEEFERLEVQDGKVVAGITLERKTSLLDLEIHLQGDILVICDRCLENFWMEVDYPVIWSFNSVKESRKEMMRSFICILKNTSST